MIVHIGGLSPDKQAKEQSLVQFSFDYTPPAVYLTQDAPTDANCFKMIVQSLFNQFG